MSASTTKIGLEELNLKQYEQLVKEIETDVAETRLLERLSLGATAAVWTWLAAEQSASVFIKTHPQVWLIPGLIAFLGGLRSLALLYYVVVRAGYIRRLEKLSAATEAKLPGWETYLNNVNSGWQRGVVVSFTAFLFWASLLGVSILIARSQGWACTYQAITIWGSFFIGMALLLGALRLWWQGVYRAVEKVD